MASKNIDVWDDTNMDAFCVALRLRRIHKCPPDIERLFCDILRRIIWMGTVLLSRKKKYRRYRVVFYSEDVQSGLTLHILEGLQKTRVDTKIPRRVVNLIIRSTQNHLRNLALHMDRFSDVVLITDYRFDDAGTVRRSFWGDIRRQPPGRKVQGDNINDV